jgi:hypothetical protein
MPQTWINQKRWIAILEARDDKQKRLLKTIAPTKEIDPLKYEF